MNIHERGQVVQNRVTNSTAGTGVSVLYTRGTTTASLVVTPASIDPDTTAQPTSTTRSQDRERHYFVVLADLVAEGFNEPANGDRITEVLSGVPVVWEVTPRRTSPEDEWNTQRDRVRVRCIKRTVA